MPYLPISLPVCLIEVLPESYEDMGLNVEPDVLGDVEYEVNLEYVAGVRPNIPDEGDPDDQPSIQVELSSGREITAYITMDEWRRRRRLAAEGAT